MSYSIFGMDFEIYNLLAVTAYVYRAQCTQNTVLVPPSVLGKERLSRSAHITDEHWLLTTTNFVLDCIVSIDNTNNSSLVQYYPFSDKRYKLKYLTSGDVSYRVIKKM